EDVLTKMTDCFPDAGPAWTRGATLPGGDFPADGFAGLVHDLVDRYPGLPKDLLTRLARAYGTRTPQVLGDVRSPADLGQHFGADLYEREVRYLRDVEWAGDAGALLWRRSKLGLCLTDDQAGQLQTWLAKN
ncbi:MAG: glycerol-3-phosphate dehydrogenase C-terminal domain-containing protein, partial [Rhodospirillales bacterium]